MYTYNLSTEYDPDIFVKYRELLDQMGMAKERLIRDVNDSLIQIYRSGDAKVVLHADAIVDATYIESDINLDEICATE